MITKAPNNSYWMTDIYHTYSLFLRRKIMSRIRAEAETI